MSNAADFPLAGRCALVTGGARRLGEAIVRKLHAGGASVAVHHRTSGGEADSLISELNAIRTGSAAAFACDLLEVEALPALIADVVARFGRLDILVNNASVSYTHLRAHETVLDLVCRLLLEKKKPS